MKKTFKKASIAASLFVGAAALAVGALNVTTPTTAQAADFTATAEDFYMMTGASVRTETNSGIRFAAYISDDYVASLGTLNTDYEIGMAIIPKSAADGIDGFDVKNIDAYLMSDELPAGAQIKPVKAFVPETSAAYEKYGKDGENLFMMTLTDIPETKTFWETEIIANAYIKVGNEYTFVTDFTGNEAQQKDIAHVAAEALAANEEGEILDQIIGAIAEGVEVPAPSTNTGNLVLGIGSTKTASLVATTSPADYAVKWTTGNAAIATVNKTGKITGVKSGTTTVKATFGDYSQSYNVYVFKDTVYDFEDGPASIIYETSSDLTKKGVVDGTGDVKYTDTSANQDGSSSYASRRCYSSKTDEVGTQFVAPESFGSQGYYMAALPDTTSSQTFGVSMDYLEYAFANPSTAYVAYDYYINSYSASHNWKTNVIVNKGPDMTTNTVHTYFISRTEFAVAKAMGDYEIKFNFWTSKGKVEAYIDNVRYVTYDQLYASDNVIDFENADDFVPLQLSKDTMVYDTARILGVKNTQVGDLELDGNALQVKNAYTWLNIGFSMSYLEWVFETKGAASLSFEVGSAYGSTDDGLWQVSYSNGTKATGMTYVRTSDGNDHNPGDWATVEITKETYELFKSSLENDYYTRVTQTYAEATADGATTSYTERQFLANNQMGMFMTVAYARSGSNSGLFFDNFTVNMPA